MSEKGEGAMFSLLFSHEFVDWHLSKRDKYK